MDTDIINEIIRDFPTYSTQQMLKEYNDRSAMPPIGYTKFLSLLTQYPDVYNRLMDSKEQRINKIKLALQDAEDALLLNAAQGDIRSIEFLLKTQKEEYRDKKQLDINISATYREQLSQLDVAITSNNLPMLEADIVDEDTDQ